MPGVGYSLKWHGDRVERAVRERVASRLAVLGEFLVGEAKRRAPVDTGNLRNSIDWYADERQLTLVYGTPVDYGVYQELGFLTSTGKFVQNPYLLPALLENSQRIVELLRP
jgi:hypothetical protein